MTPEESMFNEALSAIDQGDKARARDLFTRLLKINSNNYQYWLWMSTAVETIRERTYCLKEALRLDPQNQAARRGLIMIGAMPRDDSLVIPFGLQKRHWDVPKIAGTEDAQLISRSTWLKFGGYGIGVLLLGALLFAALFGLGVFHSNYASPNAGHYTVVQYTPLISNISPTVGTNAPAPLWMSLQETYTPTPIYINTPHPETEAYRSGLRAIERQDWVSAFNFFQQVATLEPQSPDIFYYMGEALRNQKKYDPAISSYNQALQADAGFAPAYLGRALAKIAKKPDSFSDAQNDLQQAIAKDPNLFDAYIELASLAIDQNDSSSASQYLNQAGQINPGSPLVYYYQAQVDLMAGNNSQALVDAQKSNQLDVTFLNSYRLVGQIAQASGQAGSAIEALKTYLAYVPDDAQALAWLGAAYATNGQNDLALKTFDQALSINSNQFDVYMQRGSIYLQQKNADLALQDLQKAVNISSKSFDANMALGQAFMLAERYGNAYQQFSVALAYAASERDHAEVYYWQAQSLANLSGQIKPELLCLQQLLALPPDASIPTEWINYAQQQMQAIYTPTYTPVTFTPTDTRQPTRTSIPTDTRVPTSTQTPTRTDTVPAYLNTPAPGLTPTPNS